MHELTLTQEYMICAVDNKGKISSFNVERLVCLLASGLLELQLEGCILLDQKTVTVAGALPEQKQYLKPLYDFLNQSSQRKPVKIEQVLEAYTYSVTDKNITALFDSVGMSLKNIGLAEVSKAGLLGKRNTYIPCKEAVHYVIDMIRSELLENVEVTEDIASLVILLDKSGLLKTYFSKYEQREIKTKLKEITGSNTGKAVAAMVSYIDNLFALMGSLTAFYS